MNEYVLDASALIALINAESGSEKVEKYLPKACISTVNISEVAALLESIEIPSDEIKNMID